MLPCCCTSTTALHWEMLGRQLYLRSQTMKFAERCVYDCKFDSQIVGIHQQGTLETKKALRILSFLKKHGLTHAHLCCFPLEPCTTICVLVILACSGHANLPVTSPQYIYHPAVVMPEFKAPPLSSQTTATVPISMELFSETSFQLRPYCPSCFMQLHGLIHIATRSDCISMVA